MTERSRLPDRRLAVTREVTWATEGAEHRFLVTIGVHPATGKVLEVFYGSGLKSGTDLRHSIQDACVLISILLQHGAAPADIAKSLGTRPIFGTNRPASVIGAIAEAIEKGIAE